MFWPNADLDEKIIFDMADDVYYTEENFKDAIIDEQFMRGVKISVDILAGMLFIFLVIYICLNMLIFYIPPNLIRTAKHLITQMKHIESCASKKQPPKRNLKEPVIIPNRLEDSKEPLPKYMLPKTKEAMNIGKRGSQETLSPELYGPEDIQRPINPLKKKIRKDTSHFSLQAVQPKLQERRKVKVSEQSEKDFFQEEAKYEETTFRSLIYKHYCENTSGRRGKKLGLRTDESN